MAYEAIHWLKKQYEALSTNREYSVILHKELRKQNYDIPCLSKSQKKDIQYYWRTYGINMPTKWHRLLYAVSGEERKDFIADPVFHLIVKRKMNNPKYTGIWSDKSYLDKFISVKTPDTILRNINGRFLDHSFNLVSILEGQEIINRYDKLVIKPSSFTHTGNGVQLLTRPFNLSVLDRQYGKNYVLQIPIKQHDEFARLNASSVNTLRVNSVLFDTEAYVMSSFVKIGQIGEFADNHGSRRFFLGIKKGGFYADYAIDHDLHKYSDIPSGLQFAGAKVPFYREICDTVIQAHKCIPHFGFVYWDVCVDENGEPVIIEANLRGPNVSIAQAASGPFFGDYTEEIMKYINIQ